MMKDAEARQRILALIHEQTDRPPRANDIASSLGLRGKERKKLHRWLHELVMAGEIVCIRRDRYAVGAPADLASGRLQVFRSGSGTVTDSSTGKTVFIPEEDMGTALPGDQVVVRLYPRGQPPPSRRHAADGEGARTYPGGATDAGKILRVLERRKRDIVGTVRATGRFYYVVPIDPMYRKDVYVPEIGTARIDDRVLVRVAAWENKHLNPEGEIIEVIGPADDPSVDTVAVLRHYDLPEQFPRAVRAEAEVISANPDEPGPREDLRGKYILTIDPARARDFDDALSLETDKEGNRVLGVHIADVAHYVTPGSALDEEARKRGNSVYLPDMVIPMLPEQLSNGVCSLRPNEDRLTFSVFLTVNEAGDVMASRFAKTVIRSRVRLTYEQVIAVIRPDLPAPAAPSADPHPIGFGAPVEAAAEEQVPEEAVRLLRLLNELARQFRRKRMGSYALDLDVPECEVEIGPTGRVAAIRVVPNDESHQLIEECMVAANEAVAKTVGERGIPLIYRVHGHPDAQRIEDVTEELVRLGFKPGNLNQKRNLAKFLRDVADHPLGAHARTAILRSMKKAVYAASPEGHYGLSKKYYTHFTSPIRRYPDLIVHRQLLKSLHVPAQAPLYDKKELAAAALSCSATEQIADEAERTLVEIKKYRYLADELASADGARKHEAVVVNVVNFGVFVELTDLQIQGLVHVSSLSDRFVRFNKTTGTLHDQREAYGIGRRLQVVVHKVDIDNRRIDFVLAG